MKNNYPAIAIFICLLLTAIVLVSRTLHTKINTTSTATPAPVAQASIQPDQPQVLGARTKTTNCQIENTLPDPSCTPGAIMPGVSRDQVCTPGYAASVRNVPIPEKDQVYEEYGLSPHGHQPGEYEVDHLISLELGGSNDISNLWPEAAEPRPGYHEKDQLENYLHQQVCNGAMTLQQAQMQIAKNWLGVYSQNLR